MRVSSWSSVIGVVILLVIVVVTSFASGTVANTVPAKLDWSESVRQAIAANPELQAAQSRLRATQAQVGEAGSGYWPQLTGGLTYTYGSATTNNLANTNTTDTPSTKTTFGASLTATQNLFAGFQDEAQVAQARANQQISAAALITAAAQASYDLKAAYTGLLYSQNLIQLTADIAQRRENNLKLVQLRFESGRENKGSVLLSKAYLEQAKYEHLQATNALELVQLQFAKVLGWESETYAMVGPQVTGDIPLREPPSVLELKSMILETPDYAQAFAQEQSAQAGLQLSRAGFYPSLNLTGTTGNTDTQWFPNNNRWSVGANLSFPLFSGGKDYYAQRAAGESLRAARFNRQSVTGQAGEKIRRTYSAYLEAVQKIKVDLSFVEAASTREKIAREKYNNGLLTFDDWDIIETDLISRQKNFLQTQRDRVLAEAAWEQAQGKGVLQ